MPSTVSRASGNPHTTALLVDKNKIDKIWILIYRGFYPNNAGYCFNINNLLESMVATSRSCCPILVPNGRRFRGRTSALGPRCVKFEDMRCSWEIGEFLRYIRCHQTWQWQFPQKNMELSMGTSSISR